MKRLLVDNKLMDDNLVCHFVSSGTAGFVATVCGSPFDVVKSRMMDGKMVEGKKVPYRGVFDCVFTTLKNNGPLGFYAGFSANCFRIISWNIVMFMMRERLYEWSAKAWYSDRLKALEHK